MADRKRKPVSDQIRLKSFCYFLRNALAELESMSPEMRSTFGQVIGDLDLQQFKDLETLENALKKISFSNK